MSLRAVRSVAAATLATLALPTPAAAHVVVSPSFVAADGVATLELAVPNERRVPMNGLQVVVPADFRLLAAHSTDGWTGSTTGRSATWHGGTLAARLQAAFNLEVEAPSAPGTATFQAEQHYPDGGVVRWPVQLTVTPAADSPSQSLGLALVAGLGGLLVLTLVGALLWRRTAGSLQEK